MHLVESKELSDVHARSCRTACRPPVHRFALVAGTISMSSSRTTLPENPRGTVRSVRSRITSLFGRYVVDAAVCVLAVIVIVEDLVSPTATLNDHRYDRGPEIVIIPITLVVAALMLARRRMGIAAPMVSLALFGASSFPARAWVSSSGGVYLLIIVVCA